MNIFRKKTEDFRKLPLTTADKKKKKNHNDFIENQFPN